MKKFLVTTLLMLGISGVMLAQTAPAKTNAPNKKDAKTKTATTSTPAAKPATTAPTAKPATTGGPVKKDGTPDMRFKENKNKPAAGPLKKDGTPDKRYKANKKS